MIIEAAWLDDYPLLDCSGAGAVGLLEQNIGSGPEPRTSSTPKPNAHGAINRTRYWEARIIELVGYVGRPGDPRAETTALLDDVRGLFHVRDPHTLRVRDAHGEEHELTVVVASRFDAPVAGWVNVLQWAITLEAPDPRLYRVEWIEVSYEPTLPGAITHGFTFPLHFPLVFSAASTEPSGQTYLEIFSTGTTGTPVELTLEGPVTALKGIRNRTTGEEISFGLIGLAAADVLVVDTGRRTVLLNDEARPDLIDAAGTTWFDLYPGENRIDVDGSGFAAGQTRLTARYREANL